MALDYKHHVPGYRRNRPRGPKLPWARLVAAVVVITIILAVIFSGDDESETAPESQPQEPKTTQLPAPPIKPLVKSEDKKPQKAEAKVEKTENTEPAPEPKAGEPKEDKPAETRKSGEPPRPPKLPEPRFSFYKILPEKEVIIPESEIKSMKQDESQGNKPEGAVYLIQAGSFPNQGDAEKLKARLSQIKVKSSLESVRIDNVVWHRVKIGPFSSLADADRTRAYLRANHIDSVVQKGAGRP